MSLIKGLFPKLLILAVLLAVIAPPVQAQNTRQVKGVVYDEAGEPFPGVIIINRKLKLVATTDVDGKFSLDKVPVSAVLTAEMMGYVTQEIKVADIKKELKIFLQPDTQVLEESVVTGIFTRRKDSFTGSVQSMTSEDIKRVSNSNVVESLKNLDPSLLILDNLEAGSNPNAMASMQIRGASTLAAETSNLKSNFLAKANQPLFILDGFETTLEKVTDMDMNRVQSITILKDASAKAIYGSKGANGVIVIETKALTNDKSRVTYNGSLSIEAPDLTSYNLCNSLEKLEVERREGYYVKDDSFETIARQALYNERLKKAMEGQDTYWLSKPLRLGIGQKHSVSVELGSKELKALATFSYNDTQGAMKGSYRDVISGNVNVAYRRGGWTFRNIMSISHMNSSESPWGSFSEYAALNPYLTPYDEEGKLKKVLQTKEYTYNGVKASFGLVTNPMYNATIGTTDTSQYLAISDNFYAEYQFLKFLRMVARFGIDSQKTRTDEFKPGQHTDFYDTNEILRRGSYEQSNGSYTTYSGDVSAQLNHNIAGKHDLFATLDWSISQTNYEEIVNYTEGFPNSNMKSITFARQYATDMVPTGSDGLNRNLGALATAGYSYDNRYMADATIKGSASSVFGTKNHWGLFWSGGLAWNIHNERWMKDNVSWITQLKLRASMGSSGNQNYTSNVALPVYTYYSSAYYNGFTGAALANMANPNLGWEEKMDYNVGIDFRTRTLNVILDAYIADTQNLVFSRTILPSTGFTYTNDNLGKVRNKGLEASVSWTFYRKGASYISLFGKTAINDNRVLEISDVLKAYNEQQQARAKEAGTAEPVIQYYDGMPLHSIWAVRSLGISSDQGDEVFLNRNGDITTTWNPADLVNCGSSDPLFNGNFGINGEVKGFGFSLTATFYGGGYLYNSTLLNKVENTTLETNVDRRVFSGRWAKAGDIAPFKSPKGVNSVTKATSRFVQKNEVLNLSSATLYYEVPLRLIKDLKLSRLRLSLYTNDIFTFSSIEIERGTSYPYARKFSFSINASF
ncbi:MAG: SusC/RagA family TonB-linked outer membrane protein [Bacteroidales bacterium]|nr:SusC/RagA family TonB-linked outer membrane protein [Bacteroidales bacterium]